MSADEEVAQLRTPTPPWVHVLTSDSDPGDQGPDVLLITLDSARMRTLDRVFREFVRGFDFAEYFGWNWAAFDECIRDLSWRPALAYLVLISHGDELLVDGRAGAADVSTVVGGSGTLLGAVIRVGPGVGRW